MKPIISERKYADFFVRRLSAPLYIKKFFRDSCKFFQKNRQTILYTFATLFLLLIPTILFVKFSIENGYNRLLTISQAKNIAEIKNIIRASKNDFERAEFLFFPFSWIPMDSVDLAQRATLGGKKLTSAIDDFLEIIPEKQENSLFQIVENDEKSVFRGASKDIFPFGNISPTDVFKQKETTILSAFSDFSEA